ncbi:MAG: family 78 glycoside hydrolase catalytic domain [Kiritimatiellae bacterium]|nr:family 78 glycoside hydrolase catalytic domain [Kiritimatiellia bacterium]
MQTRIRAATPLISSFPSFASPGTSGSVPRFRLAFLAFDCDNAAAWSNFSGVVDMDMGRTSGQEIRIERLRCEALHSPLGIDASKPRLSWELRCAERGQKQTAYQVLVASAAEMLAAGRGDLWDSGKVESGESVHVAYAGTGLKSRQQCWWKVRVWDRDSRVSDWSEPAYWEMGLLEPEDWRSAWIGLDPQHSPAGFPWLRKTFVIAKPSEARVYIASLGYHELYLNGEKVGEDVLSPAVTQFSHRALYLTHDVTRLLRPGTNCIAIWLGYGWYHWGRMGFSEIQRPGGPVVRAQLEIRGNRGEAVTIGTDRTWKAYPSPIERAEVPPYSWALTYDARGENPDWNRAECDDRDWFPAQECAIAVPRLRAQMVQVNKLARDFKAVSVEALDGATWRVDFGSNLTGWLQVRLPALNAGQKLRFDYYDRLLDEHGRPSGVSGFDEYVASGKGSETFRNRFNYQGFRYVRITGLPCAPAREDFSAFLIHPDYEAVGYFACSNARLTSIHDMVQYTFRCLTLGGYMVDCPHYERLGYGGDGHASLESALTMYDLGPLYRSWLAAWRDCQEPNGDLPHTAPSCRAGGGPYWGAFIVAAPWLAYRQYGDRAILEENYPAMRKWLEFVESHCRHGDLLEPWPNTVRRNWFLGDWATPEGIDQTHPPSVKLIVNCIRIYCYDLMVRIAAALGVVEDAKRYQTKAGELRSVVHQAFFDPATGTYADGDQLDLAFPLLTGVTPPALRPEIARQLDDDILVKHDGHLGVGLVGVPILVKTLMAMDRNDLIFTFVNQDTYPGWGYMLKNGATTTWEHWNGLRSHIHNCYNSIGAWFYQGLAGIQPDPDAPGFAHFVVRPTLVGDVTWAKASQRSPRGTIISDWVIREGRLKLTVGVPVGATATVCLPTGDPGSLTESNRPTSSAPGVICLRHEPGYAIIDVSSGTYVFEVNIKK